MQTSLPSLIYFPIAFPTPLSPETGLSHPFHTNNGVIMLNGTDSIVIELSAPLFPVSGRSVIIKQASWSPSAGFTLTSTVVISFTFSLPDQADWTATASQFLKSEDGGGAALLSLSAQSLTLSALDGYLSLGSFYALVIDSGALSSQSGGAGELLLPSASLTLFFETPNFSIAASAVSVPSSAT